MGDSIFGITLSLFVLYLGVEMLESRVIYETTVPPNRDAYLIEFVAHDQIRDICKLLGSK